MACGFEEVGFMDERFIFAARLRHCPVAGRKFFLHFAGLRCRRQRHSLDIAHANMHGYRKTGGRKQHQQRQQQGRYRTKCFHASKITEKGRSGFILFRQSVAKLTKKTADPDERVSLIVSD